MSSQASIAAGHVVTIPHVTAVDHGPPVSLIVRMLPAQLPEDFAEHDVRIAASLGVARVRVVRMNRSMMRLELLETDPLAQEVALPRQSLIGPGDLMLLGVDDVGTWYRISPQDLMHLAVQGRTRSGKSIFVYGLISQLVTSPNLLIAISDPTGLLTRPFAGTVHEQWQVGGSASVDDHIALLETLVETMDQRIAALPPRRDQVEIGEGCPLIIAVFEEYPGLLRLANKGGKKAGGPAERIKDLTARLVSESGKAGMRLIIMAQRFEAAVIDGFTRSQCTVRLSFCVDTASSVEMLHPAGRSEAEQHAIAPPGVALLSGPGVSLKRIKSPYIGRDDEDTEYARYWDLVTAHAARLPANCP
jgi:S-DNA-T family DNA segregation ATPase FtsK/SpoIIIE